MSEACVRRRRCGGDDGSFPGRPTRPTGAGRSPSCVESRGRSPGRLSLLLGFHSQSQHRAAEVQPSPVPSSRWPGRAASSRLFLHLEDGEQSASLLGWYEESTWKPAKVPTIAFSRSREGNSSCHTETRVRVSGNPSRALTRGILRRRDIRPSPGNTADLSLQAAGNTDHREPPGQTCTETPAGPKRAGGRQALVGGGRTALLFSKCNLFKQTIRKKNGSPASRIPVPCL